MLPTLTIILTTAREPGLPPPLISFFSAAPFRWLADFTYDIYLIHPLVRSRHCHP